MTNTMIRAVAALALAAAATGALAKDDELVARMVQVEKAYIGPLFFTGAGTYVKSRDALVALDDTWRAFAADYRTYRPAPANWSAHFDRVGEALAEADAIVFGPAAQACAAAPGAACPAVVPAHEALEKIRAELRDLRGHNGFPKFITDHLTAFHGPMEAIVLSVAQAAVLDDALLDVLASRAAEADFLWSVVEKCPVDAAWGFAPNQLRAIEVRIAAERAAMKVFTEALAARDLARVRSTAPALKQAFVPVYTAFAGDPALSKLPAPAP